MIVLVRKLLRDIWLALTIVCVLLAAFQCLWFKVTQRICGELVPLITGLSRRGGVDSSMVQNVLFGGPGKILRTLMGGERIELDNAMDMLSIGFVHPLVQTILCVWAIGRAAGAVAGELDRGTLELLMAQPLPRYRFVLAHLCVDAVAIPLLCFSLWGGAALGSVLMGPIEVRDLPEPARKPAYLLEWGSLKVRLENPGLPAPSPANDTSGRLAVRPLAFGRALFVVGGLLFALSGATIALSAAGRFRWRVLGVAVLVALVQFLINVIGQMWDALECLRPLTIFYYYQPQQVILGSNWTVGLGEWNGGQPLSRLPMLAVLYGVGALGYGIALWIFCRRDLPSPL